MSSGYIVRQTRIHFTNIQLLMIIVIVVVTIIIIDLLLASA